MRALLLLTCGLFCQLLASTAHAAVPQVIWETTDFSPMYVGDQRLLRVQAYDSDGYVARVSFFAGGAHIGTAYSLPYEVLYTPSAGGTFTIQAIAYDNRNGAGYAPQNSITVLQNAAPTVSLTSPANGVTFINGQTISLAANASDSDGSIAYVEFLAGATVLFTDTSAPYQYNWTGAAIGSHQLAARARDNQASIVTSSVATINVVQAPPTVTLTAPATSGEVYQPGVPVTLSATASDSDGSIVRVEFYAANNPVGTDTTAPYSVSWLPGGAGTYPVIARAIDNAGGITDTPSRSVIVNALPSASVASPVANAVFNAGSPVPITATVSDSDGTISKVEFLNDTAVIGTLTSAPWTYTWNGAPTGTRTVRVRATDNRQGVVTSASVSIRINAAPSVTLTDPASDKFVTIGEPVPLAANASDSDGSISKVEFYAGATLLATDTSAPFATTYSAMPAGSVALKATAYDNNNFSQTSPVRTVTGNSRPQVDLTAPAAGANIVRGSVVAVSATASDSDSALKEVRFYANDALIGTDTSAPYSVNWTASTNGSFVLKAIAEDIRGATQTSATRSVNVNYAPPVVTLTAPLSDSVHEYPAPVTLLADVTVSEGTVEIVRFDINGVQVGTDTTAPYSMAWTPPGSGTYPLTATATLVGGSSTTSAPRSFKVNQRPSAGLSQPSASGVVAAGTTITVTATASDPDGTIKTVELLKGGVAWQTFTAPPYTYTWTNPPAGSHAFSARVTDNLDFTGTSGTVTIRVNAEPTLSITSPASSAVFTTGTTVPVLVQAQDSDGSIASVEFFRNDVSVFVDGVPPYSFDATGLAAGPTRFKAIARDNDNATKQSAEVTVIGNAVPTATLALATAGPYEEGSPLTLRATTNDPENAVAKVEFFDGTTKLGEATTAAAPNLYTLSWTPAGKGSHSLTAKVHDVPGASSTSAPLEVSVVGAPPVVRITSPLPMTSRVYHDNEEILMTADTTGSRDPVQSVTFNVDNILAGTVTKNPELAQTVFTKAWTQAHPGEHVIDALAGSDGGTKLAEPVRFRINRRPTLRVSAPAQSAVFYGDVDLPLSVYAQDSDGQVTRVRLLEHYYGAHHLPGDAVPTGGNLYEYAWKDAPYGLLTYSAEATDNDNGTRGTANQLMRVYKIPTVEGAVTGRITLSEPCKLPTTDQNKPYECWSDVEFEAMGATYMSCLWDDGAPVACGTGKVKTSMPATAIPRKLELRATKVEPSSLRDASSAMHLLREASPLLDTAVLVGDPGNNPGPSVVWTFPVDGQALTAGQPLTVELVLTDPDRVHFVGVRPEHPDFLAGPGVDQPVQVPDSSPPKYVTKLDFVSMPAGTYRLRALAYDYRGGATESFITVNVGTEPVPESRPVLSITSPSPNAAVQPGTDLVVSGLATDANGFIDYVEILFITEDDPNGELIHRIDRPTGSFSRPLADIRQAGTLAITAVDNAGLRSDTVYREVVLSTVPLYKSTATNYSDDYAEKIKAAEVVGTLGDDMFGEEINFYTGAASFRHTDLDVPGNNALPVNVGRRYTMTHGKLDKYGNTFGDWELDVPYMSGTFAADAGWLVQASPQNNRCSAPTGLMDSAPPNFSRWTSYQIWNGTSVNVPGAGEQSMLFNPTPVTVGNQTYRWITRDNWLIGCLPSLANSTVSPHAAGEGFVALSPDGTRYEFAWMATRPAKALQYTEPTGVDGRLVRYQLRRNEYRLYATRVVDRFENWVAYDWSGTSLAAVRLERIRSSDGRKISFSYLGAGTRATEVTDGTRKVTYGYNVPDAGRGSLVHVGFDDGSGWSLAMPSTIGSPGVGELDELGSPDCAVRRPLNTQKSEAKLTHPGGATGTFRFGFKRHHRSGVSGRFCYPDQQVFPPMGTPLIGANPDDSPKDFVSIVPIVFDVLAIEQKTIGGPQLGASIWSYTYDDNLINTPNWPDFRFVTVTQPGGSQLKMTFGRKYHDEGQDDVPTTPVREDHPRSPGNEGQLLKTELFDPRFGAAPLQIKTTSYVPDYACPRTGVPLAEVRCINNHTRDPNLAPSVPNNGFTDRVGLNPNWSIDNFQTEYRRPLMREVVAQDGIEYVREVEGFNKYAAPTTVDRYSQTPATDSQPAVVRNRVIDTIEHTHDTTNWVLNLVQRRTVRESENSAPFQVERTVFNDKSLPYEVYGPANTLVSRFTYDTLGNVEIVRDALGRETILQSYHRGIPRSISFPPAEPGLARTSMSAIVNGMGRITRATSQLDISTDYRYDVMGRLNRVIYPQGDDVTWADRTLTFAQLAQDTLGMNQGLWRQSFAEGNYRKEVYFDARWRPVMTREYDAAAEAAAVAAGTSNPTQRITVKSYDSLGRVEFESYPVSTAGSPGEVTLGTRYQYDALGRVTTTTQTSELGNLTTSVTYVNGKKTVTDPRGVSTEYEFRAFDQPDESSPSRIVQAVGLPEAITTTIVRNVFGNTTSITRSGSFATAPTTATRSYVYDADQRLCKRIEPETGTTLFHYDAVGNLDWSAEGLNLPSLACETETSNIQKTTRIYDGLNRLKQVDYPGAPAVDYTYYADGALDTIESTPDGVVWDYEYNLRRLLKQEKATFEGQTRTFVHAYDTQGSPLSITYPGGLVVDYAPNGLGQPTKAGGFATGVQYHPNGAVKQFAYGNGVKRCNTLNARQLVGRTQDGAADANCVFATSIHDFGYEFDANGNVGVITDNVADTATRTMHYDALNRLTKANGRWDGAKGDATDADYSYDPLDNLRTANIRGRKYVYSYDETTHRLSSIANNGTGEGFDFGYDLRGNQTRKSTTSYTFDSANRLAGIPGLRNLYSYDGHGRRVLQDRDGKREYSFYTQDGLQRGGLDAKDPASKKTEWQIYLGKSLLATWSKAGEYPDAAGPGAAVTYHHTDALGSPVLETDASGAVVRRIRYAPYGESLDAAIDGPGYTGHVMDGDSGLIYMQQRYYDPIVGKFMSIDPVAADPATGTNFNRYWYANNNPYRYTDPDGRYVEAGIEAISITLGAKSAYDNFSSGNYVSAGVDTVGVVVDSVLAIVPIAPGAVGLGIQASRRTGEAAAQVAENAKNGAKAEAEVAAELGDQVAGARVTLEASTGQRSVADFVKTDKGVVEVKSGGGKLTPGQKAIKADIAAGRPVTPRGQNAANAGLEPGKPTQMKEFVEERR